MRNRFQPLLDLAPTSLLSAARAVAPQQGEFPACKSWLDGVFPGGGETESGAILKVLYEDVADGVARVPSWRGTPFQIGEKTCVAEWKANHPQNLQDSKDEPNKLLAAASCPACKLGWS